MPRDEAAPEQQARRRETERTETAEVKKAGRHNRFVQPLDGIVITSAPDREAQPKKEK